MRKINKAGLAALLLAASLGGYSIGMESVRAAEENVEGIDIFSDSEEASSEEATVETSNEDFAEKTTGESTEEVADTAEEKETTVSTDTEQITEGITEGEDPAAEKTEISEEQTALENPTEQSGETTDSEDNSLFQEQDSVENLIAEDVENPQDLQLFGDDTENQIQDTSEEKSCGAEENTVFWTLTPDGTLKISGQGAMKNWSNEAEVPWDVQRQEITKIEIADGVTSVGAYAFSGCVNVTETVIPDSIQEIGEYAFFTCSGLSSVTIG